jgi:hypothetical protein
LKEATDAQVCGLATGTGSERKKFSYQEEIREIFKGLRVAFDGRYVWD